MNEYIKNLSYHYSGMNNKIKDAFVKKEKVPNYSCNYAYITIFDEEYPACLKDLYDPPMILYYQGNLSLLKSLCVGVIGSRKPNQYAIMETKYLVEQLRKNHCIVSGLAYGIDIQAHKTALDFKTIAVLGCGMNYTYPKKHKYFQREIAENHLLLTEYPENVPPRPYHFPIRNRIIAGLSKDLFIMAAAHRSGTMHTANIALELNRNIYCLPYRIGEISGQACNQLIQDGATVLTKDNDKYNI